TPHPESAHQRPRFHATRWANHHWNKTNSSGIGSPARAASVLFGFDDQRYRRRNGREHAPTDLRSLLYDQAERKRHGIGADAGTEGRCGEQWIDQCFEHPVEGHESEGAVTCLGFSRGTKTNGNHLALGRWSKKKRRRRRAPAIDRLYGS